MENIFHIPVSYYRSIGDTEGEGVKLLSCLFNPRPEHLILLEQIRAATDDEEKSRLKKQLPLFTPSAYLTSRKARVPLSEKLISRTEFMQFDIDGKDNPGIDACQLRDAIAKIPFVAYVSISASGHGVWGLVRIECPEKLDLHYQHFRQVVEGRTGIKLDPTKGSNATDLRYISYDPDARINYAAVPLPLPAPKKTEPKPIFRSAVATGRRDSMTDAEVLVCEIVARGINLLDDYGVWFAVGSGFAREFGENGRAMFHAVSQFDTKYSHTKTDKEYSRWVKDPNDKAQIGTFFNLCKQHGLLAKDLRARTLNESRFDTRKQRE